MRHGSGGVNSFRPASGGAAKNRRNWPLVLRGAKRRQGILRSAVFLVAVLVGLVAARGLGAPDVACGVAFTTALLLVLARLLAFELRLLGPVRAVGWSLGLVLASLLPVIAGVHPGALLAEGSLVLAGDALDLGPDPPRRVLLAVAAEVKEGDSLTYRLAAGHSVQVATVLRQSFRTPPGSPGAHWHEDRPSLLLQFELEPGVRSIHVESAPGNAPPLRVRAYSRWLHPALPATCVLLALFALLLALGRRIGGTRRAGQLATVMVTASMTVGFVATPDHAMSSSLAGLAAGLVLGVPAGSLLHWLAQAVRRPGSRTR